MDKAFDGFIDWLKSVVVKALDELVRIRIMELEGTLLNVKEVADKLNMSPDTFRTHQHEFEALGFPPELPTKKWKKLAVLKWLADEN